MCDYATIFAISRCPDRTCCIRANSTAMYARVQPDNAIVLLQSSKWCLLDLGIDARACRVARTRHAKPSSATGTPASANTSTRTGLVGNKCTGAYLVMRAVQRSASPCATSHEPDVLAMSCVQGTREGTVLMPCRPSHLKTRLPCFARCLAGRNVQEGIPSMSSLQAMPRNAKTPG